jgi:uncharacterized protein
MQNDPRCQRLGAVSRSDHPHHGPALTWLDAALDDCEIRSRIGNFSDGCGRVSAFGYPPQGVCSADAARRGAGIPACHTEFPRSGDASIGRRMATSRRLCEHHRLTANDIPDAWIAAAVMSHHDHLVSFGKGFRRFLKANEFTLLQP